MDPIHVSGPVRGSVYFNHVVLITERPVAMETVFRTIRAVEQMKSMRAHSPI